MIEERIERYAADHSAAASELLQRLGAETRATQASYGMSVGQVEGTFLSFLVFMKKAQRVLEIGTFTGWSSIAMASALPPTGTLVTCDMNEETTAIARRFAEEAGVADRIEYRVGPASETLASLEGPFDLVFLDANKDGYVDYYEALLPLLADDGVIVADNTLFALLDGDIAASMERFNTHVRDDPRVECVLLTIRDGVTLIRKRQAPA